MAQKKKGLFTQKDFWVVKTLSDSLELDLQTGNQG